MMILIYPRQVPLGAADDIAGLEWISRNQRGLILERERRHNLF